MAIFGPKPWVNPFGKMSIFRLFELVVFIAQKGVFSFQNIVKKHFPGLYFLKIKSWKNGNFWTKTRPKPQVKPFAKMSIFRLFDFLVFIAQKNIFSLQNIVKDIFLASIASKKVGKMAIFRPKPWVNRFGKMSIFRLFKLLVFIVQKGVFSFQNLVKHIFLASIA